MRLTRWWWEVGGEKPSYNFTTSAAAAAAAADDDDVALSLQQVSILKDVEGGKGTLLVATCHSNPSVVYYNWINQLSNETIWWLDICCLLYRYQLHVSAVMAIFRLID